MPKIKYCEYKPSAAAWSLIDKSIEILTDYESQGYQLTLRQLYYQLVSRDIIPNNVKSYNNLGSIISRAREAGLIDWEHIVDRSRHFNDLPHWEDASHFMQSVAPQFHLSLWEGQPYRVFVFVEKEALEQVVARACKPFDVPYFANKGYLSSSSIWQVAHNEILLNEEVRQFVILHLGDHDPSGMDMSRDIEERIKLFSSPYRTDQDRKIIRVRRIALNMDQIDEYEPPPNPAKTTDSRFVTYQSEFGDESWELDALEPSVINELITNEIKSHITKPKVFSSRVKLQDTIREQLAQVEV